MRDYKFRGKRVDNGEWVYGYYYQHEPPLQCLVPENYIPEKSKHYILQTGFADWNMYRPVDFIEVDSKTVGQYTGQNDNTEAKNEIYDGDMLVGSWQESTGEYSFETMEDLGVVSWDDIWGRWTITDSADSWSLYDWCREVRVVGNIHDHPKPDEEVFD